MIRIYFSSVAGLNSQLRGESTSTPTEFPVRFVVSTTRTFS